MKKLLSDILSIVGYVGFLYLALACTVWEFRNPKANKTTLITELPHVLKWERLPKYQ